MGICTNDLNDIARIMCESYSCRTADIFYSRRTAGIGLRGVVVLNVYRLKKGLNRSFSFGDGVRELDGEYAAGTWSDVWDNEFAIAKHLICLIFNSILLFIDFL
jgi:hypothetical protein